MKLDELAKRIANHLAVEELEIKFDKIIDDSRLYPKEGLIVINEKYKDNYIECAKSLAHEYRHVFQIYYANLMNDELAKIWREELGLICKCHNLFNLELPLEGNKDDNTFKIYVTDTGLFTAMLEEGTVDNIINGDLKVYKGAIFENIIADAFNKMNKSLYYYHKQSGLEIDFVIRYNNEITLIEVKSNNGNAKALKEILNNKSNYNVSNNFKLADANVGTTNGINTIPLYMAFLIK